MTPTYARTTWTNPCKYMYMCTRFVFKFATVVLPAPRPGTTTAACPHATRYQSLLLLLCSDWSVLCLFHPRIACLSSSLSSDVTSQNSYDCPYDCLFGEPVVCIGRFQCTEPTCTCIRSMPALSNHEFSSHVQAYGRKFDVRVRQELRTLSIHAHCTGIWYR